jgi:type IV pilus assembly protein PilO
MNPRIEKLLKLPLYKRLLCLGVVVLLVIAAFGWFMIVPQLDELSQLEQTNQNLETELIQKRQIANNLPKFKAEFAKMEKQLEKALTKLPNKKEIPTLLTNLAALAKDSGLDVKTFKPQNEVSKGFFAEVPASLQLQGAYHDIAHFAQSVGELSRIVNLSDLKMGGPKVEDGQVSLQVDCKVTTFRFVDQ